MSLGSIIDEAVRLWQKLRAGGQSKEQADCALERTIRETWPKGRAEPWHYVCELCSDTGLRIFTCRKGVRCDGISTRTDGPHEKHGKYRRLCAKHPESDYEHEYGMPCVCVMGDRFRDKPKTPDDFMDAGKTAKPPRPFKRFGDS